MAEYSENDALKEFIREMTLRIERSGQAVIAEVRGMREDIGREMGAMRGEMGGMRGDLRYLTTEIHDMRSEIRAQTRAILRVLDRFDEGGASPSTG